MEFIKIFLVVMACQAPNFTECKWMQAIDVTDIGPIECQKARIPVSSLWKAEIRKQGFPNWEVFTRCELVNPEKNGERG